MEKELQLFIEKKVNKLAFKAYLVNLVTGIHENNIVKKEEEISRLTTELENLKVKKDNPEEFKKYAEEIGYDVVLKSSSEKIDLNGESVTICENTDEIFQTAEYSLKTVKDDLNDVKNNINKIRERNDVLLSDDLIKFIDKLCVNVSETQWLDRLINSKNRDKLVEERSITCESSNEKIINKYLYHNPDFNSITHYGKYQFEMAQGLAIAQYQKEVLESKIKDEKNADIVEKLKVRLDKVNGEIDEISSSLSLLEKVNNDKDMNKMMSIGIEFARERFTKDLMHFLYNITLTKVSAILFKNSIVDKFTDEEFTIFHSQLCSLVMTKISKDLNDYLNLVKPELYEKFILLLNLIFNDKLFKNEYLLNICDKMTYSDILESIKRTIPEETDTNVTTTLDNLELEEKDKTFSDEEKMKVIEENVIKLDETI